jgi:hypothetical protein
VVVNRAHKQALKTAVFLVFSVYSEVYKAVFSPEASLWGLTYSEFHLISSSFILVPFPQKLPFFQLLSFI